MDMKIAVTLAAIFVSKNLSPVAFHWHNHCLGVAYYCYRHTDVAASLEMFRMQSAKGHEMLTKS